MFQNLVQSEAMQQKDKLFQVVAQALHATIKMPACRAICIKKKCEKMNKYGTLWMQLEMRGSQTKNKVEMILHLSQ